MQVGSVGSQWGASRLWHDPNYEISRDYRPQPVQKGIESGEALPKEEHLLPPERPQDPYTVQESAYDVAAAQMSRGVEAQKLLQGQRTNERAFEAAVQAAAEQRVREDVTRTMVMAPQAQFNPEQPGATVRAQQVTAAAPGQTVRPQGTSATASEREAQRAAQDASDTSQVMDAVAVGMGSIASIAGATKVVAAAGASAATTATSAVTASTAAATAAAGGATVATHEDGSDPLLTNRRS